MNILKGSAIYLHEIEKLPKDGINYLMMNFPFQCNYRCYIKCCNLVGSSLMQPIRLEDRMKFLDKCRKNGARVLVFAGEGEPTMDRNFKQLIKFAHEIGYIPYIFTNGSLIEDGLAEFLADCDASLIINVDFFQREKYDAHVNLPGAFETVMKNLNELRKIYRRKIHKFGSFSISSLAMNLVLNNENGSDIESLKIFCGDDIVPVVNQPIKIGAAAKHWNRFDEICNFFIPEDVSRPLGTLSEDEECSYLRNGISLGADGRILTCAYALNSGGAYGNNNDDILLTRGRVLKSVDAFYEEFGIARCILRHPKYLEFIARLELNSD